MSNEKFQVFESNVPMWEIDGNKDISAYANEIAEINYQLKSLEIELKEMNENVEGLDKRINIYLGNIFNIPDFEQSKHAILIKEDYSIEIYHAEDLADEDEDEELTLDKLPDPLNVHKSSQKQALKILNYLQEYNDLIDDFNITIDDYSNYAEAHKLLWEEVKEAVRGITFLSLASDDDEDEEEVESFDEEKHVLLIAQNDDEEWGFRYIRKEDEEKFNKYLSEQLHNEEE